jgi:DNA-binding NarL/FixJ family response regulator
LYRDNLVKLLGRRVDVASSASIHNASWLSGTVDVILFDAHDAEPAVLSQLVRRVAKAKLVIMNADWDGLDLLASVRLGAAGFVLADAAAEDVLGVIHHLQAGIEITPPSEITSRLYKQVALEQQNGRASMDTKVSMKEREVLRCILDGLSNKEISARLNISESTVKNHVHHILLKLGCRTRADLIRKHFGSVHKAG